MEWSASNPFLTWAGALVVTVSRAAGLEPPLDTVYRDLSDAEGFRQAARLGRSLGFQGKVCLHPDQVAIANEVFTPGAAEIAKSAEFPWDIVELFRDNGIFGTLADEEFGGIGTSALKGFVHTQNARLHDERARNSDTLLHSAREFFRIRFLESFEANLIDRLLDPLAHFLARGMERIEAQSDILIDRQPRQ